MKRIIIIFIITFVLLQNVQAREISFIYINGSGSNDTESKRWFFDGIEKFHPYIKKDFEDNPLAYQKLLNNGQDTIKSEPVAFFWGDVTQAEIEGLTKKLNYTKLFSPKIAQFIRESAAYWLHDAIWASKYQNVEPLVEGLHEKVMAEYNKGNQIVLFGYSAGSFVSYNYLLQKSRYIEPYKLISESGTSTKQTNEFISKINVENTCAAALKKSKLVSFSASGEIVVNQDLNQIKEIYPKLNDYTGTYCVPDDAIKGVVNFASPFALFYSEMTDPTRPMAANSKLLYIYILESGKFLLNVNWSNDPLAFPFGTNLTFEDAEKLFNIEKMQVPGYVYDKSDKKSRTIFLLAHDSYWSNSKRFAKNVVQAYEDGYEHYCEQNVK